MRNVVFVNVGYGVHTGYRCAYDGAEEIAGAHAYLGEHGDDCAEMAMFREQGGWFHSHAGHGAIHPRDQPLDAVFVTKDLEATGPQKHVVLGMYPDATPTLDGDFTRLKARSAVVIPPADRGQLRLAWPGRVRMWPRRHGVDRYPEMLKVYRALEHP